ncbi:methionine synthase [Flexivirga sp. B27]
MTTILASGVGSLPGDDVEGAARAVRETYGDGGIPYLVELPERGPGADLIGRTAAQLSGLAVELQPTGWHLTDSPGHEAAQARGYVQQDLDVLAEVYDGYAGPLKLQFCGPWTLAAALSLPKGERAVSDTGALRDIAQSLADTVVEQLTAVKRLVPGAELVVQWDEPGLPAVLEGRLPTASGLGKLAAIDTDVARDGLRDITEAVAPQVDSQVLHCCAPGVPVPLVRQVDGLGLSLDTARLRTAQWDGIAEFVESGRSLWAGLIPTDTTAQHPREFVDPFAEQWHRVGLESALLERLVVTPACGLAGSTTAEASRLSRLTVDTAKALEDAAVR